MKKTLITLLILIITITGCGPSNKYASQAILDEEQVIDFEITETAYEKLVERMDRDENDELVVLLKGGC
jgi:hypothetical protein